MHKAADGAYHVVHDIEPDPAAGDRRHLLPGRESRQEQEIKQLGPPSRVAIAAVVSPRSTTLIRNRSRSMPRPSSLRMIWSIPARWRASRWIVPATGFARSPPLLRHLQAVVQRVANQMVERCLETVEYISVDAGGLAGNLKPGLLAKLPGHIADQRGSHGFRQPKVASGWSEPRGAIDSKVFALASKLLDRLDSLSQLLQTLRGLCLVASQSIAIGRGECVFLIRDAVFQKLECLQQPRLLPLEPPEASTSGGSRWVCIRASPASPRSRTAFGCYPYYRSRFRSGPWSGLGLTPAGSTTVRALAFPHLWAQERRADAAAVASQAIFLGNGVVGACHQFAPHPLREKFQSRGPVLSAAEVLRMPK